MRDDSLFRLYSMTKPITSVALLMLYEEGKFQLYDPLDKYIPAFKDVQVLAGMDGERMRLEPPRRKPTIHDVFRHTAGFSYGFNPQDPIDRAYAQNGVDFGTTTSLKQLVAENLPKVPLLYHPGDRWVYSVAHDVQAYLVEYFSGMPFDEFCRTRIFEPLGMTDATFGVPKSVRVALHGQLCAERSRRIPLHRSCTSRRAKACRRRVRRAAARSGPATRATRTFRSAA